jgi:hypothetical protein
LHTLGPVSVASSGSLGRDAGSSLAVATTFRMIADALPLLRSLDVIVFASALADGFADVIARLSILEISGRLPRELTEVKATRSTTATAAEDDFSCFEWLGGGGDDGSTAEAGTPPSEETSAAGAAIDAPETGDVGGTEDAGVLPPILPRLTALTCTGLIGADRLLADMICRAPHLYTLHACEGAFAAVAAKSQQQQPPVGTSTPHQNELTSLRCVVMSGSNICDAARWRFLAVAPHLHSLEVSYFATDSNPWPEWHHPFLEPNQQSLVGAAGQGRQEEEGPPLVALPLRVHSGVRLLRLHPPPLWATARAAPADYNAQLQAAFPRVRQIEMVGHDGSRQL